MLIPRSAQRIARLVLTEHACFSPGLNNFRLNPLRKLRVSLDGDEAARGVHALNGAALRRTQQCDAWRTGEDNILVHLLDALFASHKVVSNLAWTPCARHYPRPSRGNTYQFLQPEDFLSFFRQVHVTDRDLPPLITSPDLYTQRTTHDLMSEADPENADSILREDLLGESD